MVLTHFVSHPRLSEITEELSKTTETFTAAGVAARPGFELPAVAGACRTPHLLRCWPRWPW